MYLEDSRLNKERKALAVLNADIERLEQELAKKKNDYWQRIAALGPKVVPVEKNGNGNGGTTREAAEKVEEAPAVPVEEEASVTASSDEEEEASAPAKGTRGGRKGAAVVEELDPMAEEVIAFVRGRKEGVRAEEARSELGWDKGDFKKAVDEALASGRLTKKGERRSTTYHAR
jgi:hypothetical protein